MNYQLSLFDPVEIPLTQGKVALVDRVDADLAEVKWCAVDNIYTFYARRFVCYKKTNQKMHRVILARALGRALHPQEEVDHINGDGLDNRRCNLRVATHAENARNRSRSITNNSGYKGVSWHKATNRWQAAIKVDGKRHHLGLFTTPEAAHAAYCAAAKHYFGEFARTE